MPSNNVPLRYVPKEIGRIQRDIALFPNATMEKVYKAAQSLVSETEAYAKANHDWVDRTNRATDGQRLIVSKGGGSGRFVRGVNKFYMIFGHTAVDPRNNQAYGYYLENKIYNGRTKPYGNIPKVVKWLGRTGLKKALGRIK